MLIFYLFVRFVWNIKWFLPRVNRYGQQTPFQPHLRLLIFTLSRLNPQQWIPRQKFLFNLDINSFSFLWNCTVNLLGNPRDQKLRAGHVSEKDMFRKKRGKLKRSSFVFGNIYSFLSSIGSSGRLNWKQLSTT